ncbi:hypothetical protein CAPTEDRAFT_208807, partial [Capitella teleta]
MPGRRSRLAIRPNIGPKAPKPKVEETLAAVVEAVVEEETVSTAVSEPLKSPKKPEPAPKLAATGRRQKIKPTVSIKRKSRSDSKLVAEDEVPNVEVALPSPPADVLLPLVEPTPDPVDSGKEIVVEILPKSPKKTIPVCPASPVKRIPRPSTQVSACIPENDENVPAPNIPTLNRPAEPQVPTKPRRKLVKIEEPVDRTKMTMKDFIYMNPINNPMKSPTKKNQRNVSEVGAEEETCSAKPDEEEGDNALPAPQVTIGPDGSIILNEQSVIIPTEKKSVELEDLEVVDETDAVTGKKFNKEDKLHRDMVEKALNRLGGFSLDLLNEPESDEEPQEKKKAPKKRKPKEPKELKELDIKPPRPKRK